MQDCVATSAGQQVRRRGWRQPSFTPRSRSSPDARCRRLPRHQPQSPAQEIIAIFRRSFPSVPLVAAEQQQQPEAVRQARAVPLHLGCYCREPDAAETEGA